MAIACFRLLTFLPLRPLLSVPFFRFRITRSTSFDAPFEYLRAILLLLKMDGHNGRCNFHWPMFVTTVREILFRIDAAQSSNG